MPFRKHVHDMYVTTYLTKYLTVEFRVFLHFCFMYSRLDILASEATKKL